MKKTLIIMLMLLSTAGATVRYVSKTGSSTAPYISWATAADSLQKCLDICQYGDTIYIGEGKFEGLFTGGDGLTLIGAGIDKSFFTSSNVGSDSAIYLLKLGINCKLLNITFQSQRDFQHLGGIKIDSNSYIAYNKFIDMDFSIQGSGSSKIYNNYFISNSGQEGINFWLKEGIIEIADNYFKVHGDAIDILDGSPLIRNNIFIMNDICLGIYTEKVVEIDNNLFLSTGPNHQSSVFASYYSKYAVILNNVAIGSFLMSKGAFIKSPVNIMKNNIALNGNVGFAPSYDYSGTVNFAYNNSFNNTSKNYAITSDTTNLSADPMFVNENVDSADVYLQAYSPMIDMGDPAIKDVDGSRSDIGLYGGPYGEAYLYRDLSPKTPKIATCAISGNIIKLYWNRNTEVDLNKYCVYKDYNKDFTIDSTKIIAIVDTIGIRLDSSSSGGRNVYFNTVGIKLDSAILGGKDAYFRITAVDKTGHESRPSESVGIIVNGVDEPKVSEESYMLYPAYPNPFNPSTRISYKMKERGHVKLQVYTLQGELVSTLVDREQEAGYYEKDFTGKNLNNHQIASGVYLYRVEIKNNNSQPVYIEMKKMIYLK